MQAIKQSPFWSFIYNTVGLPIAAAAMALSSLSVIVNSAHLKRVKLDRGTVP